jgi:hypothetical protein
VRARERRLTNPKRPALTRLGQIASAKALRNHDPVVVASRESVRWHSRLGTRDALNPTRHKRSLPAYVPPRRGEHMHWRLIATLTSGSVAFLAFMGLGALIISRLVPAETHMVPPSPSLMTASTPLSAAPPPLLASPGIQAVTAPPESSPAPVRPLVGPRAANARTSDPAPATTGSLRLTSVDPAMGGRPRTGTEVTVARRAAASPTRANP